MKRFQSAIAVVLFCILPTLFTIQVKAQYPQSNNQSAVYTPASEVINNLSTPAVSIDQTVEEPAEEVTVEAPTEEITVSADAEPVEFMQDDQQTQTLPSDAEQIKKQILEEQARLDALAKRQKEIEEGKKAQESMAPVAPALAKPIETSPDHPDTITREIPVIMPAMCENLGLLLAGMDAAKAVQGKLGVQAVNDMFVDIDAGKTCPERLQKLSKYVDLSIIRPYPVKLGPMEKEIITNPKDWRLAAYNIGYDLPFTHWSQQRVAKKALETLQDYIDNEQVLLDHIQYFKVPSDRPDLQRYAPKVDQMKKEMPSALTNCLHESWRWSTDVKLCQWMDAKDAPLWVSTWAKNSVWGMIYKLTVDSPGPLLVAYLPESGEYVFWAKMCGGNGGWLPSGAKASFKINPRETDCDKITGAPLKFTSDSEQGQYKVQLGTQGKPVDFTDVEIRNSKWMLLNPQGESLLGTGPQEVSFSGARTVAASENILRYTADSRMKPQTKDDVLGEWRPMSCYLTLAKELPAPKIFPSIQCSNMQYWKEGKRWHVKLNIDNPDNMKYTVVLLLNSVAQKTTLEGNGSYSFADSIPEKYYDTRYLTAELRDENGQQFRDEKGSALSIGCLGQNHPLGHTPPPPPPPVPCKCKNVKADTGKLKRNQLDQVITLTPKLTGDLSTIKSAMWTKQDGSLIDKQFVNPDTLQLQFHAGQLLPTEPHKHQTRLKAGSSTFKLTVTAMDGTVTECRVTITVKGSSIWPWLLLAAIVIAVVVIIVLSHGAAAAAASKIAIAVKGVLFPITMF